ncbi:MAG: efflux RND transporter permease subunit [Candidatus Omnitrophica bacterium]|nr:efflux RND transporter permease subunit [Candidatus Omnitrophota bacterium]
MRLAEFSIRHSLLVNLVSLFVIVVGFSTLFRINREAFPNVTFDVVTVQTAFPGATPQDMEKHVTIPIEKELKEVDDIDEITSISTEGQSIIVIQLDPNVKNKMQVVNDIQRAVDRVEDFPADLEDEPLVEELRTQDQPVIEVSLTADLPERELREHARALRSQLEDIPHVSKVERRGWREQEIAIEVDTTKLAEWHLSLEEVIQAVSEKNLNLPGGTLKTPAREYLIRTLGEFETAEEVRDIVIRANDQGNWVRVRDVAQVSDTFEEEATIERTNGERAINLIVIKKRAGDVIKIVDRVKKLTQTYQKEHPEIKAAFIDDISFFVKRRLNVLTTNGIFGAVLVVGSLIAFLSLPVALMTAAGIPFAMFLTLIVMHSCGINLNLISMFGLIMVLGLIVDDSIVIGENIYTHIERGEDPKRAAVLGTQEVLVPVTATVLTTIWAFLALSFMTGIIGKYVREISIVAMIAMTASLSEAVLVLPVHIADFVKHRPGAHDHPKTRSETHWFKALDRMYAATIAHVLSHRFRVVAALVLAVPLLFLACRIFGLKFILFPSRGIEQLFIRADAPLGTGLEKTEALFGPLEKIVDGLKEEELENYITAVGKQLEDPSRPATNRGSHLGQIQIYLTPSKERKRSTEEIVAALREGVKGVPGFDSIVLDTRRPGPPSGKAVEVTLRGDDFEKLLDLAGVFKTELAKIEGVTDIKDDFEEGKEELRVSVDANAATQAGLTTRRIATAVRNAFEGGVATTIKTGDVEEEIDVVVRLPEEERKTRESFNQLLIPNPRGNLIPLREVAHLEEAGGINFIKHLDGKRAVTVTAGVDEKRVTSQEANARLMQAFKSLPEGFSGYTVKYGGEAERTRESLSSLFRAFWISGFLIFITLAAQFRSVTDAVIVMASIPFGVMGVVIAFLAHGEPLNFMAILGTIGLAGVAVNDAIVLVSFIQQRRAAGLEIFEAIVDACRKRLRPVLLTTLTTAAGLMPVAYGWGTKNPDPFVAPAALAISWGIIFSTTLTLLVVPCLYSLKESALTSVRRLFQSV